MTTIIVECMATASPAEIAAVVGSSLIVERAPLDGKRLTGLEIGVSFAISIAANAAYLGIQESVRALARWIKARPASADGEPGVVVIAEGVRLEVTADTAEAEINRFILRWVERQHGGHSN